jgi:hypothetical protein
VQWLHLLEQAFDLAELRAELAQTLNGVRLAGATGFDELVPALESPLDLVAFAFEYPTLFGRLLSEDALRLDEVAQNF